MKIFVAGASGVVAIMEQTVDELPESVVLRYGLFYGPGTAFDPDGRTAERVRRSQMPANENVVSGRRRHTLWQI